MDIDDLRQECYYGFVKAADKYDPSYNVSFLVYSRYYIHGYGMNAIQKHNKTKMHSIKFEENLINHNKNLSLDGHKDAIVVDNLKCNNLFCNSLFINNQNNRLFLYMLVLLWYK